MTTYGMIIYKLPQEEKTIIREKESTLKKKLPDLKSIEHSGDADSPLQVVINKVSASE